MTWHELNRYLMSLQTEAAVQAMIEEEMRQTYPRERWVLRMYARLHRLRARREQKEVKRQLRRAS